MYFKYAKEVNGYDSIVRDYGFCLYAINEKELFMADIYIEPDYRNTSKFREMCDEIEKVAKDNGCEIVTAREYPASNNCTNAVMNALKVGFKILSCNDKFIVIGKRI